MRFYADGTESTKMGTITVNYQNTRQLEIIRHPENRFSIVLLQSQRNLHIYRSVMEKPDLGKLAPTLIRGTYPIDKIYQREDDSNFLILVC